MSDDYIKTFTGKLLLQRWKELPYPGYDRVAEPLIAAIFKWSQIAFYGTVGPVMLVVPDLPLVDGRERDVGMRVTGREVQIVRELFTLVLPEDDPRVYARSETNSWSLPPYTAVRMDQRRDAIELAMLGVQAYLAERSRCSTGCIE
jgi:hypothetical protein